MESETKQIIKEVYSRSAEHAQETTKEASKVAQAFGYSKEDLETVPQESNMGLSCGNPIAIAGLKEGEVVVDLGSGGGLDCFLAAKKVGKSGKVIGVDMTPSMVELAKANAIKSNLENVEFRLGEIDALPIEDSSVDCVISNCVINLTTDKQKVFDQVFRVLKPGGRLAISDICLKKDIPSSIREKIGAYVSCASGVVRVDQYREMMEKAGFEDIVIVDSKADLKSYVLMGGNSNKSCGSCMVSSIIEKVASWCGYGKEQPPSSGCGYTFSPGALDLLIQYDVNEYAGSFKIYAVKSEHTLGE